MISRREGYKEKRPQRKKANAPPLHPLAPTRLRQRSIANHSQALNLARFALGLHLERAATNLAVSREALLGHTGINGNFHQPTANGTLDGAEYFHNPDERRCDQSRQPFVRPQPDACLKA